MTTRPTTFLSDFGGVHPRSGYDGIRYPSALRPRKGFAKFTVFNTELSGDFVGSVATSTFTDHFTIKK